MMQCSICGSENGHLAVVCVRCGGFLQQRVENLDLFACAWSVLERPARAFRNVALARHKNYVLVLAGAAGIGLVFAFFWLAKVGEYAQNLVNILGAGFVVGPPAGIVAVLFVSVIIALAGRLMRLPVRLRDAYAVTSYAAVPVVLTVVLLLPIEIMSFGLYFFTRSPSPYVIRPFSYVTLMALDGLFALWAVVLLVVGVRVLFHTTWLKSVSAVGGAMALMALAVSVIMRLMLPHG